MESIRQTIDSNLLDGIISLPIGLQNKKVEIIISLKEEKTSIPFLTRNDIDAMLENSITKSLIGVLPKSDIELRDYRAERLAKYDRID